MKKERILPVSGTIFALLIIFFLSSCETNDDPTPNPPPSELGTVLWSYDDFNINPENTEMTSISAAAVGSDGTIYVSCTEGSGSVVNNARVHAINSDSTFKWASPQLNATTPSAPAIGSDGTIYVICWTTVFALSPNDGSIIWSYQPSADENEQHQLEWLTLGNDGQVYFAHIESGAYARKIFALNSNGQELWKRKMSWGASNLMVGTDGTLFASWKGIGNTDSLSAIDPVNGSLKWSKNLENYPYRAALTPDGDIVLSQQNPAKLIKRSGATGEVIWEIEANYAPPSVSSGGLIYIVSSDVYCYNPDGSLNWRTGSSGWGNPFPIAIDADGNSYGSSANNSGDGNFNVLKPDGSLNWAIYQAMSDWQCPAIGPNNVIYVTVSNNPKAAIYAIQGDNPLASAGWVRDMAGNRNSRNINLH